MSPKYFLSFFFFYLFECGFILFLSFDAVLDFFFLRKLKVAWVVEGGDLEGLGGGEI